MSTGSTVKEKKSAVGVVGVSKKSRSRAGTRDSKACVESGSQVGDGLGQRDELTLKLGKVRDWFWDPWPVHPKVILETYHSPFYI